MKQPKLRFPEFTGDWKQHKFEDVVTIGSGKDYKHLESGNVPVYGTGGYMLSVNQALSESEDAVGIGRKGTIDKPYILRAPFWTVDTLFYCIPNEGFDLTFTNCLFQNVDWKKKDESTGVPSLSKVIINNVKTYVPSLEEQQKIASLFTELDSLIQSAEQELEGYRELKQGMLQKMFPKKGEKVPEIRFPEFTGDWEQRKVLDLLELLTDYDANGSFADMAKNVNTTDGDGYAWYVRITDLENPKPLSELKYVDESSYEFLKKTELHGGELLMAKRGDIGKVYIFEPRTKYATVGPNMYLLKLNNKVISHFLHDYFVSEEGNKKLTRLNASSTMGALYKDDVKNIDVIMPSIEEQAMIGNFFQSIDHLITLQQRELNGYKELKKGLLQQMFC